MPESKENVTYDVAISFLGEDEEMVKELYDIISDRLDTFYYAERQEELVGKDGEEAFGKVFRDKSRVVVIFYREKWGKTMMTRAEKSAIKQRAANEGYNFTIWIPLDGEKKMPPFIDPQYIWFNIDRFGMKGLAAVIEKKVQESGRDVSPETVADRLKQINKSIELEEEREKFVTSSEGVEFVNKTDLNLEKTITTVIEQFQDINETISFDIQRKRDKVKVTSFGYRLDFDLDRYASNSIRKASLTVYIQKMPTRRSQNQDWKTVEEYKFIPTLDEELNPKWFQNEKGYTLRELTSLVLEEMAELVFKAYANYKKDGKY